MQQLSIMFSQLFIIIIHSLIFCSKNQVYAFQPNQVSPIRNLKHHDTDKLSNNIPKILKGNNSFIPSIKKQESTFIQNAWPLTQDPKGVSPDISLTAARLGIVFLSTVGTWYAQQLGHSNVLASSAITLIFSMCFDKRLGQAAFCGSFAGMSSSLILPNLQMAASLGVLTSILFEFIIHTKNLFLGIGGRLGATAFIATSAIASYSNISSGVSISSLKKAVTSNLSSTSNLWGMLGPFILWHSVGSVATIILREASDDNAAADPVRASATIGLLASLLVHDKFTALCIYAGSFAGMSLPSKLMFKKSQNESTSVLKLLSSFAVAGGLGGLVHGLFTYLGWWTGAWGGKAGFFSFVGCLLFRNMAKIRASFLNR